MITPSLFPAAGMGRAGLPQNLAQMEPSFFLSAHGLQMSGKIPHVLMWRFEHRTVKLEIPVFPDLAGCIPAEPG